MTGRGATAIQHSTFTSHPCKNLGCLAMSSPLPSRDQAFVHFYRAVVGHMDVWRQRMDATTNWAVATTAVMLTFTFTSPQAPHFVMLMAIAFDAMFLFMESRRYQTFDLWRRRFRSLNHYLIVPTLAGEDTIDASELRRQHAALAKDLGRTVPHLPLLDAVGYRIRRNYVYLFSIGILAWLLKLEVHPVPAEHLSQWVSRAQVGFIPGSGILAGVTGLVAIGTMLAIRAPSEGMLNWTEVPSPFGRWVRQGRKVRRAQRISGAGKRRRRG
jgi:uncharacterized membrane protein